MAAADGDPRLLRHPLLDPHRRWQLRERSVELFDFLAKRGELPLHLVGKLLLGDLCRGRRLAPGLCRNAGRGERCPRPGHELVDLLLLLREPGLRSRQRSLLLGAGDVVLVPLRNPRQRLHRLRALEDTSERVVVGLGDRIELVVVTASAAERQPHERLAGRVDLLVDDVGEEFLLVSFGQDFGPHRQESGGREQLRPPRRGHPLLDEKITGQMGPEKGVEGFVAVEGGDAPVAVAPGVAMGDVFVEPVGVGVADDVEPMPGLMLAVAR